MTAPAVRRRGEVLEAAIFDAVWAELAETGYSGLTIGAVADRARTSKAVLYRRWQGRAELVIAALLHQAPSVDEVPDTGSLRSDLLELLRSILRGPGAANLDALWGLLADAARDPELREQVSSIAAGQTREGPLVAIVERGIRRGEVDPERLTQRRLRLPLDLLRGELMLYGTVADGVIEEILDEVFLPLVRPASM
ncbi:TetR/AcrR family transcriptional regulator [Jiangella gansuensis]|uniref:TetR/AcrR family transcriptional regulator n=1 Tax=Jiangella gansuensis TaxID=281473 RepID=UPI00047CC7CA|nr:TetR/AcrR family transcriptional regulator [Jiangella gansuensis]